MTRARFQAPDAFSGDEDDGNNNDEDGGARAGTLNTTSGESRPRLSRVKAVCERFSSPLQRCWRSQWQARICSMLCCLLMVSFIAVLSAFLYVILKGKICSVNTHALTARLV